MGELHFSRRLLRQRTRLQPEAVSGTLTARNTGISDYLGLLQELGASGNVYFLEGGQAVNF